MKSASAGLIAMLQNNDQFFLADLYTFTLQNGNVYRYTDADIDLVYGGNTFIHNELRFKRSGTKITTGIEVDTLNIDIYPQYTDSMNGIPFLKALAQGQIDGASVKLERAIMTTWGDLSNGVIVMFLGRISESNFTRTYAKLSVKSELELLNIQMPRNLYNLSCSHAVYDAGCTLLKSSFATNSSVNVTSTKTIIYFNDTHSDGYFDQGLIEFTSGVNNGLKRTIKTHLSGSLEIALTLPNTPSVGDTFIVYAGCDRTKDTCTNKFNNLQHFRGFPYIPPPEAIT